MTTIWQIACAALSTWASRYRGIRPGPPRSLVRSIQVVVAILLFATSGTLFGGRPILAAGPSWSGAGGSSQARPAADNDDEDDEDEDDQDDEDDSSPLSRRRDPPNADEELIGYFDANENVDAACSNSFSGETPSAPEFRAASPNPEVGTLIPLCFAGFAPNGNVDVQLKPTTGPSQRTRLRTDAKGIAQWNWPAVPTNPLPEYTVTATQGRRTATGTFVVEPATQPRLLIDPRSDRPGATFTIYLVGFDTNTSKPGDRVRLRLHRYEKVDGEEKNRYLTDLSTVTIDARGQARSELRTSRSDRKDKYTVSAVDTNVPAGELGRWVFVLR